MFKKLTTKDLAIMGILIAMQIILGRFFAIPTPVSRISFSFIPIAVAGMLVGPVWAGLAALIGDFLGTMINSFGGVYFPLFGITEFCYGFIYGLFFYKKEITVKRILLCLMVNFIFYLTVGAATQYVYWNMFMQKPRAVSAIVQIRLLSSLVNYPVRFIVLCAVQVYMKRHVKAAA